MKELAEFIEYHQPALEVNEVKHNLILGLFANRANSELRLRSMDAPGACAIRSPGHPIILGVLTREQCHRLADETRALEFPGVVGSDDTAEWFVERAIGNSASHSVSRSLSKSRYYAAAKIGFRLVCKSSHYVRL